MAVNRIYTLRCEKFGFNKKLNLSDGGIYCIKNTINNKVYIGSAEIFRKRRSLHCRDLNKNKHHSKHLQRSINKYGIEAFQFIVMESLSKDFTRQEVFTREKYWIEYYKSYNRKYGYNILREPNSRKGLKNSKWHNERLRESNLGKKHSEESKLKMSITRKLMDLSGDNNRNSKAVVELNKEGIIINRFECIKQAANSLFVNRYNLSLHLNKKRIMTRKLKNKLLKFESEVIIG